MSITDLIPQERDGVLHVVVEHGVVLYHGADACMRLNRAVIALPDRQRTGEIIELCKEIDAIESSADRIERQAVTKLFENGGNPWTAMKMREFYLRQENVLDRCEDAAKTIEEILIENS